MDHEHASAGYVNTSTLLLGPGLRPVSGGSSPGRHRRLSHQLRLWAKSRHDRSARASDGFACTRIIAPSGSSGDSHLERSKARSVTWLFYTFRGRVRGFPVQQKAHQQHFRLSLNISYANLKEFSTNSVRRDGRHRIQEDRNEKRGGKDENQHQTAHRPPCRPSHLWMYRHFRDRFEVFLG